MRYSIAAAGLAALAAANPMPQVTSAIAPSSSPPAGCQASYSGTFEIQVVNVTGPSRRDVELVERQNPADVTLVMTLNNGILKDQQGRTGYIAANQQFQFDGPPQTGAIYTAGWSVCGNQSLALGGMAYFYQCLSGTFYNLYDASTGAQCSPVHIQVIGGSSGSSGAASNQPDGQPTASAVASQMSDGQITASPVMSPVCQLTDGQPQVTGCPSAVGIAPEGQPQATTGHASATSPVAVAPEGQPQATTAASSAVAIAPEGQPQATTASSPVAIAPEGQPQATTASSPVAIAPEGQPQATTASGAPHAAANGTLASATPTSTHPATFSGMAAATQLPAQLFGLAAAGLAVAFL